MAIDRAAYDHYWAKGWVVVENVFTADETERIADLATQVSTRLMEQSDNYRVDKSDAGEQAPRKIDLPYTRHDDFARMATDARMRELTSDILNDEALLARDQIFMKPPRFGSAKPYHQDNSYFRIFPSNLVLTAWIALDDVDESNGCLRYIDASHKGPILPHTPVPGEPYNLAPSESMIDLTRESLAIVGKGGVVFHHGKTLHTSHRNHSDRWRRAYATHWVGRGVTNCDTDVLDQAHGLRDDYADRLRELHDTPASTASAAN